MKKQWLGLFAAFLMALPAWGQTLSQDDVITLDSRSRAYREGEILVKFKSSTNVTVRTKANGAFLSSGVSGVDAVLNTLGATEMEALMPITGSSKTPARIKAINGSYVDVAKLNTLYRVKLDNAKIKDVHSAIESLESVGEVEYAEPNYLVYAMAAGESDAYAFEDPLYPYQWGPGAINLPGLWAKEITTKKRPVIAILDTGVDTEHPDLADNIWTNEQEKAGASGYDDDDNGFRDDLHGWDFVNQTGNMRDFNGHGTHCAGIAAATGNNGVGVVGANPDALIMPVAVLQSDGVGDVATIIKGIDYAVANGADIISMSYGGYAYSIAHEQALARAYSSAVLVAAAGNDYKCIYPHDCLINKKKAFENGPVYPAAFTFVLGVEATDNNGNLASFSNYDCDGPSTYDQTYFSEEQMYNYELRAPGTGIYSTYPGGKYKSLNGTSMACPLVAGAVSRLMQTKEIVNKEVLFGDLIRTRQSNGVIDILAAYNLSDADRKPQLSFVTYNLVDSVGGDGDCRPDAGEKISVYPVIRNWGNGIARNIKVWITMGENEDETIVTFLDATMVNFAQPLSAYAKAESEQPFQFQISDSCVDGRHIKLVLHATCDNMEGEITLPFTLTVENGVEIGGMIEKDTTLEPGVHYIVTRTIVVPDGVTLTILPGTILRFKDKTGIVLADGSKGNIVANGTSNNPIIFTSAGLDSYPVVSFDEDYIPYNPIKKNEREYIIFDNIKIRGTLGTTSYLSLKKIIIQNCIINGSPFFYKFDKSLFHNNSFYSFFDSFTPNNSSLISNQFNVQGSGYSKGVFLHANNISGNYSNAGGICSLTKPEASAEIINTDTPSYFGSAREDIVRKGVYDIEQNIGSSKYDLSNMLTRPNPDAPGILWKVVVNGYDAQDEFEQLPPLGVGTHKFEIYYSHPQDKSWTPTIAMGVRPPYTQLSIDEKGSWNEAGDIYTAYITLTGKTAVDGLNRIYVSSGKNADGFFPIPLENRRFNVLVSASGAMSVGFEATAGLGQVDLAWEPQEENVDDILGYNLYRYQYDEEGAATDTLRLNELLIDDVKFTDFDVVPGQTYCYYYKIMRTNLTENSPSMVVAATPLTADKGDANGSLSVDVADVITEIGYMTNQDPKPFIFDAADVNSDAAINILDVVGTINIILNPDAVGAASIDNDAAVYTIEDGVLYVETPVALGGLQFSFAAPQGSAINPLAALDGFEKTGQWNGDQYIYLVYSMSGKMLAPGKYAVMSIGAAAVESVILSDTRGNNVLAVNGDIAGVGTLEMVQMTVPYPNPFNAQVTIPYVIGKEGEHEVSLEISDLMGRAVNRFETVAEYGSHSYTWTPAGSLAQGMYVVSFYVDGVLMQTSKVIYTK